MGALGRDLEIWDDLDVFPTNLGGLAPSARKALFYRERNSHRGIRNYINLKKLKARAVNQEFLEEICDLKNLEFLSLEKVSASDLSPLKKLKKLSVLKISDANKVTDFSFVNQISELRAVYITNAKQLGSVDFLTRCDHLVRIGVEGSIWARQKLASLKPLSGLNSLQELYLTSVGLEDKNLSYLAECPKLEILDCARFAPKKNFEILRELMPSLSCHWCDRYEID